MQQTMQERAAHIAAERAAATEARLTKTQPESLPVEPTQAQEVTVDAPPAPGEQPAAPLEEDFKAKYEEMAAQYSALHGRLAPAQRDLETFRHLYETESQARARLEQERNERVSALEAQLAERSSAARADDIQSSAIAALTEEERNLLDPSVMQAVAKMVAKAAASAAPPASTFDPDAAVKRVMEERDANSRREHLNAVMAKDPNLNRLAEIAESKEFDAFRSANAEVDLVLGALANANSNREIDRIAVSASKLLGRFLTPAQAAPLQPNPVIDPQGSLARAAARTPAAKLTPQEIKSLADEAKSLARNRTPEAKLRYDEIMQQLA